MELCKEKEMNRNRMATRKRRGELFTSGGRKDAKREGTRFFFRTGNPPHSLFFIPLCRGENSREGPSRKDLK